MLTEREKVTKLPPPDGFPSLGNPSKSSYVESHNTSQQLETLKADFKHLIAL